MEQNPQQEHYNQTINLTSHLILTQPKAVIELLAVYGVRYTNKPSRKELINEVVEQMKDHSQFATDLGELLAFHVQENGNAIKALGGEHMNLQDEEEDAFLGGLIKGAAQLVGGLFNKKKRGGDGGAAAAAKAQSQASAAKRDMQMQMLRMQQEQRRREAEERRRREAEQQRQREAEARRQREKTAKAAQAKMNIGIAAGAAVLLMAVGLVVTKSNKGQLGGYYKGPPRPPGSYNMLQ